MKLVIDIPDEDYEFIKDMRSVVIGGRGGCRTIQYNVINAIMNGTPVPKGHGRLIDADALKMDKRVCGDRYLSGSPLFVANKVIEQAPTIIEADKGEEE